MAYLHNQNLHNLWTLFKPLLWIQAVLCYKFHRFLLRRHFVYILLERKQKWKQRKERQIVKIMRSKSSLHILKNYEIVLLLFTLSSQSNIYKCPKTIFFPFSLYLLPHSSRIFETINKLYNLVFSCSLSPSQIFSQIFISCFLLYFDLK